MSSGHTRLPVVDLSAFYEEDARARKNVAATVRAAVREWSFFYLVGHRIGAALVDALITRAESFFRLPFEEKMGWYIGNSKHHRGYVPEGEEILYGGSNDRKEAFDLALDLPEDDADVLRQTPMLGPNVWPDIAGFREDVGAYYSAVFDLGQALFRAFALALDLDECYFSKLVTKPPSQLRLIHYPFDSEATDANGIGAHTDYECFTILLATAPGLEVMNEREDWIDAPPREGAFVVTIGDMMEVWTNGEFRAATHRVRRVSRERYSFPFFCACDYHTVVQPLSEFVSAGRPARYDPVSAGAHLFAQTARTFAYLKGRARS
jgi:isopenicillin N synthase-like dioxygenase